MRILVTNDDGIHSPGLWSLARALTGVGRVSVVAPDRDMSGVGTAMIIQAATALDSITDTNTAIDGNTQTATTGNTNAAVAETTTGPATAARTSGVMSPTSFSSRVART